MVCKNDVVTWFKSLKSYKRIDVMSSLLQLCMPFELRFLGTCLEDLAKRDFQDLRQTESEANNVSELSTPEFQSIINKDSRIKLALYVSLLHSCNEVCSNRIFKILTKDDINSVLKLSLTDDNVLEELLSIYTIAVNHPAFTFDQKLELDKIFLKLQEEEHRLIDQTTYKNKQKFSTNIQDAIIEKPQTAPIHQSYQPYSIGLLDDQSQPCYVTSPMGHHPSHLAAAAAQPVHQNAAAGALLATPKTYIYGDPYLTEERRMGLVGAGWTAGGGPIPTATALPAGAVPNQGGGSGDGSPLASRTSSPCQSPSRTPPPGTSPSLPIRRSPPTAVVTAAVSRQQTVRAQQQTSIPSVQQQRHSPPVVSTPSPGQHPSSTPLHHHHQPIRDTITKELPTYSLRLHDYTPDQLRSMNDEELKDMGLPLNVIVQLRSILNPKQQQIVVVSSTGPQPMPPVPTQPTTNGLPHPSNATPVHHPSMVPAAVIDTRKKPPEVMMRNIDVYGHSTPGVPCLCYTMAASPAGRLAAAAAAAAKYHPVAAAAGLYPAAVDCLRMAACGGGGESLSSGGSDSASDHSPPDTPGPADGSQPPQVLPPPPLSAHSLRPPPHHRPPPQPGHQVRHPSVTASASPSPQALSHHHRRRGEGSGGGNSLANGAVNDERKMYSGSNSGPGSCGSSGGGGSSTSNGSGTPVDQQPTATAPPPPTGYFSPQGWCPPPPYPLRAPPYPPFAFPVQPAPPPAPRHSYTPFPPNGEVVYSTYATYPYPAPPTHMPPPKLSCYNCGSPSHAPVDCPESTMEEITKQGQYRIDYQKQQQVSAGHQPSSISPEHPSQSSGPDK